MSAKIIQEIDYPEWFANVVLVQKHNGKWRVCVNYKDLNNACPKDYYSLIHIYKLIDATSEHGMLSFMDVFLGYHNIRLAPKDVPRTLFITHREIYAYVIIAFGLLNSGATYQHMMKKVFNGKIGRNIEFYVDYMIVKSIRKQDHIEDLEESSKKSFRVL